MELSCEKHGDRIAAENAACRHVSEYCKFRHSCMIHFLAQDQKKEKAMDTPDFSKGSGLIPAIAQDAASREILMLAYINAEAWQETLATGIAHYWSRSRNKLWRKGESSGHTQKINEIRIDCDNDTVVFLVEQKGGAACHTGHRSCFYRVVKDGVFVITEKRVFDPEQVYGT